MPGLQVYKKELDYSYAAGLFPSMEALKKCPESVSRVLLSSKLEKTEAIDEMLSLCESHHIRTETADHALVRLSGKENVFVAIVFKKKYSDLLREARHLVLHQPSDKGNLGTMLRTALGFDFMDIAIITPAADYFDPHVVRASMGALFSLRIKTFSSFDQYRAENSHHHLFFFMLQGSRSLDEAANTAQMPYSLVMGNEATGLPHSFSSLGQAVRIPHNQLIDSLNLSSAAAIGMYAFNQSTL